MTLREIVFLETLSILTEEKVSSFVISVINRYNQGAKARASRIEAVYNSKNNIDKRLYNDDLSKQLTKNEFRKECIARFNNIIKTKETNLKEHEFIILMDEFLSHFDSSGRLLPK